MIYFPYEPPQPVGHFVESVFYLSGYQPEHSVERIVPDTSCSLVIELDGQERWIVDDETHEPIQSCRESWISGPHRKYFSIKTVENTELMAVRFRLGGLHPLIKVAASEVTDRVVKSADLLGESVTNLRSELIETAEPEAKVHLLARWLQDHIDSSLSVPSGIQQALDSISESPSLNELSQSVARSGFSQKHAIELFKKHVGLRPKDLQRIIRFSQALASVQSGEDVPWTQLSIDCGYNDQSHFIRDFKKFSGFTPSGFRGADFDRENFFPVEE